MIQVRLVSLGELVNEETLYDDDQIFSTRGGELLVIFFMILRVLGMI